MVYYFFSTSGLLFFQRLAYYFLDIRKGVELPLIAKLTGLSKKEVEKLAKELKN